MYKWLFFVLTTFSLNANAQQKKLYNPLADAATDIEMATAKAKAEGKYLLIQAGGNWCKWCIEFARFATANPKIDSVMNASFVWYHLNFSQENENKASLAKLGFPQRFGFPVFIIVDGEGQRLHTQNSEYLEDGKSSYNAYKVQSFLEMWSPAALDKRMYSTE